MIAYKLLRVRKDGTLGPLFIERKRRIPIGEVLQYNDVPTKGYAHRPGWHCCQEPVAPHLKLTDDRRWYKVDISGWIDHHVRPESQGGLWFTAERMEVIEPLT